MCTAECMCLIPDIRLYAKYDVQMSTALFSLEVKLEVSLEGMLQSQSLKACS